MIRSWAAAIAGLAVLSCALPASAQAPWTNQIDPAAIYDYDPDGGAGMVLTSDLVRAYLQAPIAKPAREQSVALLDRRRNAEQARASILSDERLFAPLWEENAFELQDGTVRPMTVREKAVFTELETVEAGYHSLQAQGALADASGTERAALADALCRMLDAGVRLAGRQSDGYRKIDENWVWLDWENGAIASSRLADAQVENALLRYELAKAAMKEGARVRRPQSQPPVFPTAAKPF